MESVSKVGDVVIMENGERYVVFDCIEYNEEMYLKISGIIENNNKQEYVSGFVREIVSKDNKYSLEIVDNPKLINILNSIMAEFLEEDKKVQKDQKEETPKDNTSKEPQKEETLKEEPAKEETSNNNESNKENEKVEEVKEQKVDNTEDNKD